MSRIENRIARLREIEELLLLNPIGLAASELGRRLNVHRRTVYRDLDFLSTHGVPLWQDGGRFGINRTRYLTTLRLSFHEAIALVLAGLLLARTVVHRNPHIISALRRLALLLPGPLSSQLDRAAARVMSHGSDLRQVGVLEIISEGWCRGQKVRVGYRSPRSGALRQRILSPYALEPTATGVYVIGHDDWSDSLRTFKLDRLENACLTHESYVIPSDFDPEESLAPSWGIMTGDEVEDIVLHFTAEAAPYARERTWHSSQKVQQMADGSCRFQVSISNPVEIIPWIRSWGAKVEVLSPEWLREEISEEHRSAAALYDRLPAQSLAAVSVASPTLG